MKGQTVKVRLTTGPGHVINFGSAEKPQHKADGEEVSLGAKQAEELVKAGLATYVDQKEEGNHGN